MNIAIDLTAIPKNKSGVGRYLYNLVEWLQKIDSENSYYLFMQDDDLDGFNIYASNFHKVPVSSKWLRKVPLRLLWEQLLFPKKLSRLKIDLLHSPHYTTAYFSKIRKIVNFHDFTYFVVPQMHTFLKRELFKFYIKTSLKNADSIIVISKSTQGDLENILNAKRRNVFVTPMGVDERFFLNDNRGESILGEYGIKGDYILYVGTIEPRKNVLGLLKAYNMIDYQIRDKYKLVICGKKGWMYDDIYKYIEENRLMSKVVFTGFVKDEHLPCFYRYAKLFLYPSFYEGFGIPIIEAMASGVPTITSNISSMKEVAGVACINVDPYNVDEIKNGIELLLNSEELYNELKIKGIERAKIYTWENCARKTLEAYQKSIHD